MYMLMETLTTIPSELQEYGFSNKTVNILMSNFFTHLPSYICTSKIFFLKIMHHCIILVLYTFLCFTVRFDNPINNVVTQMIFDYISDKGKELYEKHSRDALRGKLAIVLNGDFIQGMII